MRQQINKSKLTKNDSKSQFNNIESKFTLEDNTLN